MLHFPLPPNPLVPDAASPRGHVLIFSPPGVFGQTEIFCEGVIGVIDGAWSMDRGDVGMRRTPEIMALVWGNLS